ncbi:TPA: glycosyltransferase family 4 protein [Klebsiella pneumoniae]|nr:glycosyltransferase family 4 protein [Klebsiella pneumoniae]HBS7399614.1 glycosyltransferase family 4 protein [Klebsiella pneumoniae]HBS7540902.1 glycosyltransferase family 4 protein [Klebsiella pneumoniae]HDY8849759.1 glycosyltransferase family 4 protein [Klebsiella pneumoniae]HDZ1400422.1 glycosyltransferase family 4 protein [Klebsiella pneumoniae]
MRVLHVYKTYYPDTYGGIEQVIYQLSQGCARRGIAADVFTFSPDKETGPVAYEDHRVIYNKQLFEIASTPFSLKALKRFKQIKDDYDIINYHFPFPFMDMLHLSARPDARTVVTYHSDIVKQKRLMKLYQPLQERFLASVDCIVASSPNYVASSQTLKKYQDKTVVIPFGLEQHDVQHDPQRVAHWRETVGDNFFLFVGAFRYYKGLHILLDAAERSRLPVVIVGGGPLEAEVRREAQQRGLSNVVFTGMLNDEDKYILFQLCRGLVFPSHLRSEAFGITLLEGARFARPLISCEIGTGTSFINQDKVNGCVIPPNDSQALVEAMNELWHNDETASRYGENSRRRFEEMFTADHMIDAYVNLYTTLLESKS